VVGRWLTRRVAIAGTLLLTGAGLAGTAWAGTAGEGRRPLAVVSLGDSYISGNAGRWLGNSPDSSADRRGTDRAYVATPTGPTYDPTRVYGNTVDGCWRSDVAEVTHVRFPRVAAVNLACSGATTASIPQQTLELAGTARTHRVLAIVLSIGGNDIRFSNIVGDCTFAYLSQAGACNAAKQADVVAPLLPEMRAGLGRAIDDIRATMAAAGYHDRSYRLIVQSYPAPLPTAEAMRYPETDGGGRTNAGGCPFYDADVDWGHTSLINQLADSLRAVAAERHVQFLDVRDAFRGHELCSAAARQPETAPDPATSEWMRWIDLAQQGALFAESLHPNAYGQQALGHCLRLALLVLRDVSCHGIPGRPPTSTYVRPLR